MINRPRQVFLTNACRLIMVNMPQETAGKPKQKTQIILNRIESIAKTQDEYKYMVDCITVMVKQTKGVEVEIYQDKKLVSKEKMKDFLKRSGKEFNNQIKEN